MAALDEPSAVQQLLKRRRNQLSVGQTGESTAAQATARCLENSPCSRMYVHAIQCKSSCGAQKAFPIYGIRQAATSKVENSARF